MEKLESKEEKEMVIEEVLKKSREREFKKGIIKGRREGILKGKREIIIEMLKNEIEDEIIKINSINIVNAYFYYIIMTKVVNYR